MKIALIVNPISGQGKSIKHLERIKNNFTEKGCKLFIYKTKQIGDGEKAALEVDRFSPDAVIAVGGDGTVSAVASGLIGKDIPMGIIPCGTVNVLALELGIPKNIEEAVDIILKKKTKLIDVGRINKKIFLLMAGIGFDGHVISEVKQEVKNLIKDLAYVLAGLKALLSYHPVEMEVVIDKKIFKESYFTIVGNARYYAGKYSIVKDAEIDDGLLDVCIFKKKSISNFVKFIGQVIADKAGNIDDVEYFKAKEVEIRTPSIFVQSDGDLAGKTPVKISIEPKSLKVIVP
ncbi:MAG: diacylglycerol kinase family lipid kinase [Actinomycetia bacterium]|nr:diacylglycerol kinase family lipid kinase [Actinomycetes bacterium]